MNKKALQRSSTRAARVTVALFVSFFFMASASAISIKKAQMSGSTLSVEGANAVNNSAISVDGRIAGSADGKGQYRFSVAAYSSTSCIVQIGDGLSSASLAVASCSPVLPPPNSAPVANAGADVAISDTDGNGIEQVTLNGLSSTDPDGAVTAWVWAENGVQIGSGATAALSFAVGTHTVQLTVTDNLGASAVDTVVISVLIPSPPPPPALSPLAPDAILESNQGYSGSFDPAEMGWSVDSAGDVNGDGFEDIVVGAPGWDAPGGLFDEGAVFVFLGSVNGIIGFDPSTAHAFIQSTQANSEFGSSVAGAGDINGDGYDDILVGAPLTDASGLIVSGAAYIFRGGPQGITATSTLEADAMLESKQLEGHFGRSVASAGDVNGDGYSDVIIGAARYGAPFVPPIANQGSGRQGAAFVFLGSATGIVGNQPANAHARLVPWADGTPSQTLASYGFSVAGAGDVNADGYDDVLVGAPTWNQSRSWPGLDTGNPPKEGAVFLYHGGPAGITGTNANDANTRIEGNQLEAFFGNSVAGAGDVNNDGYADIIIGSVNYPAGSPLAVSQEGAAYVYLGGPAGVVATGPEHAQAAFHGTEPAEWLGRSVSSAGDYDADGFDDVIISARVYPGSLNNEGISYLFRGGVNGIVGSGLVDAYARITSNRTDASLGFSARSAGDIDGDGKADIIVGVPGYANGQIEEGAAFLYQAAPSALPPNQAAVANAGPDMTLVDSDGNGLELATLDGSASFDVDGIIMSYEWREGASLLGLSAITQTLLATGNHLITLTVTDDQGGRSSDTVLVRVITGLPNFPPTANAGPDQSVTDDNADGMATVTLDASASSDSDGAIVSYHWTEGATRLGTGPIITLPLTVGVHNILLLVTDDNGSGAQDSVLVTVNQAIAPPSLAQGVINMTGPALTQRGNQVTFSVTLTNTGSTAIAQTELVLAVSPASLVKNLQQSGGLIADIPVAGSVTRSWSGSADKQGSGSVTAQALSNGVTIDAVISSINVTK